MYDYLMLNFTRTEPGRLFAWTAGIGYEIRVSPATEASLEGETPNTIVIVYTRHRMEVSSGLSKLYGFASEKERAVFDALVTVKSVGWDTALKILGIGWDVVLQFAAKGDVDELKKIKGIGPKAAMRLTESKQLLALRKKLFAKTATD